MKVLIDCDVLMDVLLKRAPFVEDSLETVLLCSRKPVRAAVAWHTFSNLAYFAEGDIRAFIRGLLEFVVIPPVSVTDLAKAAQFPMKDFEDAMQAATALAFGAEFILSRNQADYRGSPVPCLTPAAFCRRMRKA